MNLKTKIIAGIIAIAAVLGLIARFGFYQPQNEVANEPIPTSIPTNPETPYIISTDPSFDPEPILLSNQSITFNFNQKLVNEPETKIRFEPEVEYEAKLSNENKTITITPKQPYMSGTGYTIFVTPETDFQNEQKLESDYVYHFRTPTYRGI